LEKCQICASGHDPDTIIPDNIRIVSAIGNSGGFFDIEHSVSAVSATALTPREEESGWGLTGLKFPQNCGWVEIRSGRLSETFRWLSIRKKCGLYCERRLGHGISYRHNG
jgi:hypothetical protein